MQKENFKYSFGLWFCKLQIYRRKPYNYVMERQLSKTKFYIKCTPLYEFRYIYGGLAVFMEDDSCLRCLILISYNLVRIFYMTTAYSEHTFKVELCIPAEFEEKKSGH